MPLPLSQRRHVGRALATKVLLLPILAVFAGTWLWWLHHQFLPAAPPGAPAVRVEIPPGTSSRDIARLLAAKGIIKSPLAFHLYLHYRGLDTKLKAGEYYLSPSLSPPEIAGTLAAGRVALYRVTIPEGFTLKQIAARLAEAGLIDEDRFWKAAANAPFDYEFLADGPPGSQRLEGFLFPDTYYFGAGVSDLSILRRAHALLEHHLAREWEGRQSGLPYRSPYEALIMASIVEKETGVAEERPLIAGVFVNRLRLHMRLQTDPTVIYGLGEAFDGNLRRRHLETDGPYNTYLRPGLPPTPIAMPGLAAIRAALHPAPTRALYFVSRGDGTHAFSETLTEHNRAVARYQLR